MSEYVTTIDDAAAYDEERKMRLEMSRMRSMKAKAIKIAKANASSATKIGIASALCMLGFAGMMDLVDWMGVGSIPLIGDGFDLLAGVTIYFWIKINGYDQKRPWYISWLGGGATLVELIPGGDLLPTFLAAALTVIVVNTSWGKRAVKHISPI